MTKRRREAPGARRILSHWHRYAGLTALVFVIIVTGTGLMLNHTQELGLAQRHIGSDLVLDWYGIEAPSRVLGYRAGEHWISQHNDRIFFDDRPLAGRYGRLLGARVVEDALYVALPERLLVLTLRGELIERLGGTEGVPSNLTALGLAPGGRLAAATPAGAQVLEETPLAWHALPTHARVRWARAVAVPSPLRGKLQSAFRGQVLSTERLALDVHTGRLLGWWGVYLFDAMALLLALLAASGFWMWFRQRLARSRTRRLSRNRRRPLPEAGVPHPRGADPSARGSCSASPLPRCADRSDADPTAADRA